MLIVFVTSANVSGQYRNFNTERNIWKNGLIKLENGSAVKTTINFNFVSGTLTAKEGKEEIIYTPHQVQYFEIYSGKEKALFYSLPYDFDENGEVTLAFFEVVYQKNRDVLLLRHELEFKNKNFEAGIPASAHNFGRERVYRIVYMATNGKIYPVLQARVRTATSYSVRLWSDADKLASYNEKSQYTESATEDEEVRYKSILKDDMEVLFPESYLKIEEFVKNNKIKLKDIESWKTVVDFKSQLVN
ncbi:hypothetical protein C900_01116 [Fulvivirga imtechensis AK7]|uniref:Uncharacterized protein n=1 Tax=Fulvivirga imtechensis AK7 TaxID=1237149 RepID=L8JZX0_9BACT|nr:hypothetical protein C900_01116 [Fulvivirga imtechensis AK7]